MKLSSIDCVIARTRAEKLFIRLRSQRDLATEEDCIHLARVNRIEAERAEYEKALFAILHIAEADNVALVLDKNEIKGYLISTYKERVNVEE